RREEGHRSPAYVTTGRPPAATPGRPPYPGRVRRLLTPPWLVLHFLAVVLTTGFALLGWWQLSRAQEGNAISWGYAFEWPLYALFTVALWVRQMRLELRGDRPEKQRRRREE